MPLPKPLWVHHPHIRTGTELSFGERAADVLKRGFGSWAFLIGLNVFIAVYAVLNVTGIVRFDGYPFIALNLILSWLAAQQGGALQIAANRGDRTASELALSTHENGTKVLEINERQLVMLERQAAILAELQALRAAVDGRE